MTVPTDAPADLAAVHRFLATLANDQAKLRQLHDDYRGNELAESIHGQLGAVTVALSTVETALLENPENPDVVFQIFLDSTGDEFTTKKRALSGDCGFFGYEEGYLKGLKMSLEKARRERQHV